MQTFTYTITDEVGLHARPAANLARFAGTFASDVSVRKDGEDRGADAKSMLAVMSLGIRTGDAAVFTVAGDAEAEDCVRLEAFCKENL